MQLTHTQAQRHRPTQTRNTDSHMHRLVDSHNSFKLTTFHLLVRTQCISNISPSPAEWPTCREINYSLDSILVSTEEDLPRSPLSGASEIDLMECVLSWMADRKVTDSKKGDKHKYMYWNAELSEMLWVFYFIILYYVIINNNNNNVGVWH